MGRRIIPQRRGRGSPTYKSPPRKSYTVTYRNERGEVIDIIDSRLRSAPLAVIRYEDGDTGTIVAPRGMKTGDSVENYISKLSEIPVGSEVFALETQPNSGPRLCMSSGSSAILLSKEEGKCTVMLPSKKSKVLDEDCRATLGIPAGQGRIEKPWLKAGRKHKAKKAKGQLYPRTSPVKMNAVDHPFGGHSRPGKSKTISRHAPPGRKVGSISPRRTGKRKK